MRGAHVLWSFLPPNEGWKSLPLSLGGFKPDSQTVPIPLSSILFSLYTLYNHLISPRIVKFYQSQLVYLWCINIYWL